MFVLTLIACEAPPAEQVLGTVDARVDHNGDYDTIDSVNPVSCMADSGALYVAWQDDRDGVDAIWFNASADGGESWMQGDVKLNSGAGAATLPAIACTDDNVYVAWEDVRDGEYLYPNIYANVSGNSGRDWLETDVALDADPDGKHHSRGPAVAAAGSSVYVAWFDNSEGAYDIYVQASTNAGRDWLAAPVRADTDEAGGAYSAWPRIAADADGNVVVVWEDSRGGKNDIYANSSYDHGQSFSSDDTRLDGGDDGGASDSFSPSLSFVDHVAWVAWHDDRFGERDILFNVSADNGATWKDEAARVEEDAEGIADSINPVVVSDGASAHFVWQDDRSGGYDIYHRRADESGASWGTGEQRLDTDQIGSAQSYDPAAFRSGRGVIVGWEDGRQDPGVGFNDLHYNWSEDDGATWSAEDVRINSGEPGAAYAVDLTIFGHGGEVRSVWADGRYGSSDIMSAHRPLGEASIWVAPPEDTAAK